LAENSNLPRKIPMAKAMIKASKKGSSVVIF
jgi:hypothetical protein